jgi:hypothetical protein
MFVVIQISRRTITGRTESFEAVGERAATLKAEVEDEQDWDDEEERWMTDSLDHHHCSIPQPTDLIREEKSNWTCT